MATIADLLVKLSLDGADFSEGIDNAEGKVSALSNGFTGLAKIGGGILAGGLAIVAAGGAAAAAGLWLSVEAAMDSQKVQAQLGAVLKSTGGAAGVEASMVNDLANSLSRATPFEDEAIIRGESMLLTFTAIGKDIFPMATETILDMSTALGQDLQSSAIQLGKALQDPVQGVTALRRVGVAFNDEQEATIKNLVATGKLEEAQKFILAELTKEFGGSAKAAGQTFGGQLEILKTQLGNVQETVGMALLPVLQGLAGFLLNELNRPETIAFIQQLALGIQNFAIQVYNWLPIAYQWIVQAFGWLQQNQGVIIAALAVIGSALLAFFIAMVALAISAAPAFLPVLAIILLIGGAAYLLYTAWTTNFGGIRDTLIGIWVVVQPILAQLWAWLQTNIPIALQALAAFWTGTLWPAIMAVWGWMSSVLFPFFSALASFVGAVLTKQFQSFALVWSVALQPALSALWNFLKTYVWPILVQVGSYVGNQWRSAFLNVTGIIQGVTSALQAMAEMLSNIQLPSWLTPGSPTPFEIGLRGIADAMGDVNSLAFGGAGLAPAGVAAVAGGGVGAGGIVINVQSDGVTDEHDVARKIAAALDVRLRERGLI